MQGPHQHVHKLGLEFGKEFVKVIKFSLSVSAFSFPTIAAVVNKDKTSLTTNINCPALLKISAKIFFPNAFGILEVDCSNNSFGICLNELSKWRNWMH